MKRDRILSDTELTQLWAATETLGIPFGPAVQLFLVTARKGLEQQFGISFSNTHLLRLERAG